MPRRVGLLVFKPTVCLHLLSCLDEFGTDPLKRGIVEVMTKNHFAGADPTKRNAVSSKIILEQPVKPAWSGIRNRPNRYHVTDADG